MVLRFAPLEILKMAVELEKRGIAFYQRLQKEASPEVKEAFSLLAKEEEKHLAFFSDLLETVGEERDFLDNEEVAAYLGAIVEHGVLGKVLAGQAPPFSSFKGALEFGMQVEKESILFYQGFSSLVDPGKKQWLEKVIEEEKRHFLKLAAMGKGMF